MKNTSYYLLIVALLLSTIQLNAQTKSLLKNKQNANSMQTISSQTQEKSSTAISPKFVKRAHDFAVV